MDQYLNNQRTGLLWDLLAHPADKDASHIQNLQDLVNEYPQSGLLQALLTYIGDNANLQRAAAYFSPRALYKLNRDIDSLHPVSLSQMLSQTSSYPVSGYFHVGETDHGEIPEIAASLPALVPDAGYEAAEHMLTDELQVDVNAPVLPAHDETEPDLNTSNDQPVAARITEILDPQYVSAPEPAFNKEQENSIEEDTFDEIVSIDDINLAVQEYYATVMEPQTGTYEPARFSDIYAEALKTDHEPSPIIEVNPFPVADIDPATYEPPTVTIERAEPLKGETLFNDRKVDLTDEAEKLILNNIAATDFFVFDRAFGERKNEEVKKQEPQPEAARVPEPVGVTFNEPADLKTEDDTPPDLAESQLVLKASPYENIAKYHDEKMPYSFMWWLDKTRKEHSGIYQPFVEFKLDAALQKKPEEPAPLDQPDELQQQYIESIFQLNPVEELEGNELPPVQFDPKKKEDEIIERFIQEVPQIKPQSADKIDNENKAKKSSEDMNELVTETLAQIYMDQMLYPKAIDTFKKLMLKFPEKSLYFAGQIEQLKKK